MLRAYFNRCAIFCTEYRRVLWFFNLLISKNILVLPRLWKLVGVCGLHVLLWARYLWASLRIPVCSRIALMSDAWMTCDSNCWLSIRHRCPLDLNHVAARTFGVYCYLLYYCWETGSCSNFCSIAVQWRKLIPPQQANVLLICTKNAFIYFICMEFVSAKYKMFV